MSFSNPHRDRILVIAPQPFYQERGTPIAVRLLIETLSSFGCNIDLATYHEGTPVDIAKLRIFRIKPPRFIKNIPIGFSVKKIICNLFLIILTIRLYRKNRYRTVHAVEESIFIALFLKVFYDIKLVYDIDSSLAEQMVERFPRLRFFLPVLLWIERFTVRHSDYLFPVCSELAEKMIRHAPEARIYTLHDPPLPFDETGNSPAEDLHELSGCNQNILVYVGNLEYYQGVELVIDAMAKLPDALECCFVIIGGNEDHLTHYRKKIQRLKLQSRVYLIGPRPLKSLYTYLHQAQILISPRRFGNNTPMKIYSYLASGKPVMATDIKSHTQILDASNALLVKPQADSICAGLTTLLNDRNLQERLGNAGQSMVDRFFSKKAYAAKIKKAYAEILEDALD